MTEDFVRAVREEFGREIPTRFPGFRFLNNKDSRLGIAMFGHLVDRDLVFFLLVCGADLRNEFTIEAACNETNNYPFQAMPSKIFGSDGTVSKELLRSGPVRLRISHLWGAKQGYWWGLGKRLSSQNILEQLTTFSAALKAGKGKEHIEHIPIDSTAVRPIVLSACDQIAEFVLPFFAQLAAVRDKNFK